jgi:hypothetical protein
MNRPCPVRFLQVTPVRFEAQLNAPRRQVVPYRWFTNTGTWREGS